LITAGIDLAAEPKATALALIEWSGKKAELFDLHVGTDDKLLIEKTASADKIGIDCALGWPVDFIEFLKRQTKLDSNTADIDGDIIWRRRIAYRETDRHVRQETGRWPLSVATDRLGMTALRAAGLLSKLAKKGLQIDRTGQGLVVEVYPGASLRVWKFQSSGYRASESKRAELLQQLKARAPWLNFDSFATVMVESCDAFDSVIASLSARSAALGHFDAPPAESMEVARIEGWVALPNRQLQELL
jgi:predicted nuclease with RNAse H fold